MPPFWKGMPVEERKELESVIEIHYSKFFVECLKCIHDSCHIPYNNMHLVRVIHEYINDNENFGLIGIVKNKEIEGDNNSTQEEEDNAVVEIKKKLVPAEIIC